MNTFPAGSSLNLQCRSNTEQVFILVGPAGQNEWVKGEWAKLNVFFYKQLTFGL